MVWRSQITRQTGLVLCKITRHARLLVRRDWYFARLLVMQDYSSDGTGTLQEPVITIPFRPYSCAAGNYSVCLFEASTGLSGVSQPLQCEMVE